MIAALLLCFVAQNAPLENGFSQERLGKVRKWLEQDVAQKKIPGAVLLIQRDGRPVGQMVVGQQDRGRGVAMRADSVFPIASMTKPVVSVAAMMLAEDGVLDLAAPVAQYLPEFRGARVGEEKAALKRPMAVLDLMRHTSGLTYGLFGNSAVDLIYVAERVFQEPTLEAMVKKVAGLPLLHQPGEVWEYSVSSDVLARVVEVVSGMAIDEFIASRITRPLKMKDTAYLVADAGRVARPDGPSGLPLGDVTKRPGLLMGGAGLFSTAADYARFCQMLLNGGELEGVRLLSPHAVALMTADQLGPEINRGASLLAGKGFGLGFAVRTSMGPSASPGSVGDYGWSGIAGTLFWVDPKERLVVVWMAQLPQSANFAYWRKVRTMVYQALMK